VAERARVEGVLIESAESEVPTDPEPELSVFFGCIPILKDVPDPIKCALGYERFLFSSGGEGIEVNGLDVVVLSACRKTTFARGILLGGRCGVL
jgi:hypothetical protein